MCSMEEESCSDGESGASNGGEEEEDGELWCSSSSSSSSQEDGKCLVGAGSLLERWVNCDLRVNKTILETGPPTMQICTCSVGFQE